MDPTNLNRIPQQTCFVDLMNSQNDSFSSQPVHFSSTLSSQPVHLNSNFPSQPVHLNSNFSSQPVHFNPNFSSQPLHFSPAQESEDEIDLTVDENEEDGERGIRKRWTAEEDINLISAWLNTSKDPVVSNEQRRQSFWKRVADYYKANDGSSSSIARGPSQCKARWNKINHDVNKFVGCYAQASSRRKSGESEDDVLRLAYELFKNDKKKPFLLARCWRELKHDQKWLTEECNHKRLKLASDGAGASSPGECKDGSEMRPPGVKAAKKKGKKPVVSIDVEDGSVVKLDKIIAMKDKEQAAKERNSKMRLLDSLLNKSELTPTEALLRDKLVDQMLTNI
ncbi:PREDICTED: glutathione S-transferase T3-like [Camelina sativa]|uniref:Glutathione S-transferase T3-like n=1 Tax=Camelina sativa TaxID=90675 RepID=A0ABM0ZCG1_CAMSA|nr:PREDICTED: glutathione S-transferase T3-like [Camelina sativa]